MANDNFPYEKITFVLNVIGFIGSLAFYYSVMKNTKTQSQEKQQILELQKQIEYLKQQLSEANSEKK